MDKREKVIEGLECCVRHFGECESCSYDEGRGNCGCGKQLYADALSLLKAQEPHVVTIADYKNNPNVDKDGNLAVWRESRRFNGIAYHADGWVVLNRDRVEGWFNSEVIRFWTSRPTDAQREATPWE